ncbi:MAG: PspC domain-containing protein [Methanomassiliicoccales archaeon]
MKKDKTNAKWLGVCAGIANELDIDPIFVRMLFVVMAVGSAIVPLLIIYVAFAWLMDD